MKRQLISFLGRTNRGTAFNSYRTARYAFPGGHTSEGSFFGVLLADWLDEHKKARLDRILLLGTSGSMWDFVAAEFELEHQHGGLCEELLEAVGSKAGVTASLLARVEAALEQDRISRPHRDRGPALALRLIPYGRSIEHQLEILHHIADDIDHGDRVWIDVTHGFRHLAMLGLMGSILLEGTIGAKLQGLYYGALDMSEDGVTPVLDLSGLMRVAHGVSAIAGYRSSGRYQKLRSLLEQGGLNTRDLGRLEKASFFERTFQAARAAEEVRGVRGALERIDPRSIAALFGRALDREMEWADSTGRAALELSVANRAKGRGQFVAALSALREAMVTHRTERDGWDSSNYAHRSDAADTLGGEHQFFRDLRTLRNAVVHGDAGGADRRILRLLDQPRLLDSELSRLYTEVKRYIS